MCDVVMLGDLGAEDAATAGAKAANLGELMRAGIAVPAGFCIPLIVHDRLVRPVLADHLAGGDVEGSAATLRKLVEELDLPPALCAAIDQAYRGVCPAGGAVAVRSSGTGEDSAAASFAGQYHTELAVSGRDLLGAVRRCWASLWTPHAIQYREQRRISHVGAGMAVIVQVMVEADAAGVMFTADPVLGGDRVLIESSWGLGEAVVSGLVTPDRFHADRADGTLVSADVRRKTTMIGPGGATQVPARLLETPSLTPDQVSGLVRLGMAVERHFGRPQDIEWAIVDGRIAVLQARPVTATGSSSTGANWESSIEGASWARISICDSWLPEPLSPLFATTLFVTMIDRWMRNWAGGERSVRRNPLLPRPMAGTINGFGYLRLDFHLNRHPLWTARLIVGFFRFHLARLPRRWREQILPRHTQRIAEIRTVGLTALNNDAILALITDVEELSAEYWAIIGGLAWYWNTGEWLLAAMYPRLTGSDAGRARLLQGFSTKTSEAEEALYDLARNTDSAGFQADIRASFDALLDRYGHQVYNLDFIEPTPAEQPAALEATMRAYRDGLAEDPRDRLRALANRRDAQEAATLAALRRSPVRRRILTRLLRWSRLGAQLRDEALFAFTLGWPVMRRGYLELGRRLVDAGALRTADDVFFLTGDEVRAASRSPAVTDAGHKAARDLSELTARRRATRERQRLLRPPLLVPADARVRLGALDITALAVMRTESTSDSASGLRGSPVSPGRVTAPACVVLSVADFGKLRPGDVLVAPQITPAWSSLLAVAGGCVTDVGGALSHGSIVAREYGIPAVMGTIDATRHIQDGQVVTVDGDRGLVG